MKFYQSFILVHKTWPRKIYPHSSQVDNRVELFANNADVDMTTKSISTAVIFNELYGYMILNGMKVNKKPYLTCPDGVLDMYMKL